MKKFYILMFALLMVSGGKTQSCLPDGIYFRNQAEIDSFQTNYPGCTQIEGYVYVGDPRGESNITNLNGISVLTSIGGYLSIYFNALTSLTGLENLTSIGGGLAIGYNYALTSLTGLGNINAGSITDLIISDNASLSNCAAQSICDYLASPNGTVNILNNANGCNNPPEVANACGNTLPCLPDGNYYFFTQNEIDNFQTNYPNCTELKGDVTISGYDITNLNGLSVLTSIAGNLSITENNSLTSLTGLDNLTSIGGDLWISENYALTSITGLIGLTSIGGRLWIYRNAMTNLTGLDDVISIGGDLSITGNVVLTSLAGLDNVISIGGDLSIDDNPVLTSLTGLEGLTSIGGILFISGNSLTSLMGLVNLDSIGGDLIIFYNYALTSLTGLEGLTSIPGNLVISINNSLTSLAGLENATSVGNLEIKYNNALTSLEGLYGLTSISGHLDIRYNPVLVSLTGLDNIDAGSLTDLYISNNTLLSTCEVQSICDYLANPNGTVNIYNNAIGCNNPPEVANACGNGLPCPPFGNYYFVTQNEIDNFSINYPGCTILEGEVIINGDDITNLNGLSVLTSIAGNLIITENNILTSLAGLEGLTSIGNIGISGNIALNNLTGLEGLTSVGNIEIWGNIALTSFTGLDNVTSITDGLSIGDNDALTSLTGLANLTSIGGFLSIIDNNALTSLTGLDNIDGGSITDLHIQYNFSLSICEVESICDYLASPNGTIFISDNATGCSSQEEVEAACGVGVDESAISSRQSAVNIYPNPSSSHITIEHSEPGSNASGTVSVYGMTGQELIHQQVQSFRSEIDISILPAGIYFVRLMNQEKVEVGKFIKE